MRPLVPTLLALLLLIPAAAPLAPATSLADDVLAATLQDASRIQALAAAFPAGAGLGEQLTTLTGVQAQASAAEFDAAMVALYAQAGIALPADFERPVAPLASSLAPVIGALANAAALTDAAFAGLTPDERAFLLAHLDIVMAPASDDISGDAAARVHELAARVDIPTIHLGATSLALALDGFAPPSGLQTAWTAPGGLIVIGSTGNDYYCAEHVLIIDLGGNDVYNCHPASYAPGSNIPVPVSVILDLGGNDVYTTTMLHASSPTATWGQGVGIGGIGLLVDRWGDDMYQTMLYDATTHCDFDWMTGAPQTIYAQAVGAMGVGAILDVSGNDRYSAINTNLKQVNCHFGWVYTFAQGVGLLGGVGLLVDDTGDDVYTSTATARGKYDNIAGVYSQAAAAGGIGALVDKEGSDQYVSDSVMYITFGYTKGGFAYTFSQASVTATRKQPPTSSTLLTADSTSPGGLNGICPASREGAASPGAGSCDGQGMALLVDILGNDIFTARSYADDLGLGCSNGLWAVTSAQGSAAWTGVAILANLDIDGSDTFRMTPTATGRFCGYPAVRAHAYGQGFGGPIMWNFWDMPLPQGAEQYPLGILASLGIPEEMCPGTQQATLPTLKPAAVRDPCDAVDTSMLPQVTPSPDSYSATAYATNPSGVAEAQTWVQGASQRLVTIPSYWTGSYPALGIGVHIDIGGDDGFIAIASADSPTPKALVQAQGSTNDAVSALANVGGDDRYTATALQNGLSVPGATLVQGYADASTGVSTPGPICVSANPLLVCVFPMTVAAGGVAVFADIFGWESYSEAPERFGCQTDGTLLGTWPVGAPLGTVWWGTVLGHPCASPTPDVGTGTVIGLDAWSEMN